MFSSDLMTSRNVVAIFMLTWGDLGEYPGSVFFNKIYQKVFNPDWVEERLTPELEVAKVTDPGEVKLWFDPRQKSSNKPTGDQVYEAHQQKDLLVRALSLGHLQFYVKNPDKIPSEWKEKGLWVYGMASKVRLIGSRTRVIDSFASSKGTNPPCSRSSFSNCKASLTCFCVIL